MFRASGAKPGTFIRSDSRFSAAVPHREYIVNKSVAGIKRRAFISGLLILHESRITATAGEL
jgi:hypothetical protein